MATVIAICNQKGGVGKTTTSINLSACLAAAEKRVLLIDLDPQGNTTTGLGFDKYNLKSNIYDVITSDLDIESAVLNTEIPYLTLVPSNPELVGAEVELVSAVSRETRLKDCLQPVDEKFDFIIIDCPPSLGLLTLNALSSANYLIIPVQCEYFAMEGIADLQRTVSLICNRINPQLKILGIVLTMFDSRNNLSRQVHDEMRKHFQDSVFQVVIPRNVRLSEAPSYGKPIILYDVSSKGAVSYFQLAQEVLAQTAHKIVEHSTNTLIEAGREECNNGAR